MHPAVCRQFASLDDVAVAETYPKSVPLEAPWSDEAGAGAALRDAQAEQASQRSYNQESEARGRHKSVGTFPPPYPTRVCSPPPSPESLPTYTQSDPEKGDLPSYDHDQAVVTSRRRFDRKFNALTVVLLVLNVLVWSAAYLVWFDKIGPLQQSTADVLMELPIW